MIEDGGLERVRITPVDRAAPRSVLPGDPLLYHPRLLGWLQEPP
jgi:hypothetical protein